AVRTQALKKRSHSRHDKKHEERDHEHCRHQQERRIGKSSAKLTRDAYAAFQVIDKTRQNIIERTAFFARKYRCRINLRKNSLCVKCVRQRHTAFDLFFNIGKHGAKSTRTRTRFQQTERVEHRNARAQKRRKLLVKEQKIALLYFYFFRRTAEQAADAAARGRNGKNLEAFAFEARPCFRRARSLNKS